MKRALDPEIRFLRFVFNLALASLVGALLSWLLDAPDWAAAGFGVVVFLQVVTIDWIKLAIDCINSNDITIVKTLARIEKR